MSGLKAIYSNILNVQQTDTEIDANKNKLQNIEEKSQFKETQKEIERLKITQAKLENANSGENRILEKRNGELEVLNRKIKSEEQKLFSGSISNPKELSAIQQEIASLNRKKDVLETAVLEQMDKVSELENKLSQLEEQIEAYLRKAEQSKKGWLAKEAGLKEIIGGLKERRQVQIKEVEAQLLEDYEDIRESKDGVGAGALIEDTCQVCHVALPATDLERIMGKEEPDYCPNCGRILIKSKVKNG